jgi:hypothetical protein
MQEDSIIEIYGTKIRIPKRDASTYIEDWGTSDTSEQYWIRKELPYFFDKVEFDKDGQAILTPMQRQYAAEEVRRCKEGFWFYNNGIETYISPKHYFYLQWWKLEDDIHPEYRDTDRRYFLYLKHWEDTPWCLGIVRGKKRREGATSQATSNIVYECIFFRNSFCGLTSKTQTDAKAAFTNMVSFGYRQLPVFLKPKQLNNKDSVTELVFAHKSSNVRGDFGSAVDSDTGHRSKVDYRAPGKNSYDSGRLSRLLADEGGKFPPEVPFSEFVAIVSKTMVKGAKKVGFMECPSTVNEMTKGGGAEYKKVWDSADQFKNPRTPNRLVRYFTPAYDGYVGFIDKYGISVIDPPTEQQFQFLVDTYVGAGDLTEDDIRLGAKDYLLLKRGQLEGSALEEEIRMNPFDEREMFLSAATQCLFAAQAFSMRQQLEWLSYYEMTEFGDLIWENGHPYYKETIHENGNRTVEVSKLKWVSNPNGKYEKVKDWMPRDANSVYQNNGFFLPNANFAMRIGCDPFKYDKTKNNRRSNCVAYAFQVEDLMNAEDPFNDMFVMRYADRPPTTDIANEYVLKMAWFCGCQITFERNVDHWKKWLSVEKCSGFAAWMPGEVEPGVYTDGNGKTVQLICNLTESYIDKNIKKVYFKPLIADKSGWLGFVVEDTESADDAMAGGMTLISARAKKYMRPSDNQKHIENILPYKKAI